MTVEIWLILRRNKYVIGFKKLRMMKMILTITIFIVKQRG